MKMGVRALLSCSLWVERLPRAFLLFLLEAAYLHIYTQRPGSRGFANFSYLLLLLPSLSPAFHPPRTLAPLVNLAWHPHPTQGILGGIFFPSPFSFYSMHTDTIFT